MEAHALGTLRGGHLQLEDMKGIKTREAIIDCRILASKYPLIAICMYIYIHIYGLTPLPPTSLHQNTMANHNIDHHLRDTDLFIYWQWVVR